MDNVRKALKELESKPYMPQYICGTKGQIKLLKEIYADHPVYIHVDFKKS